MQRGAAPEGGGLVKFRCPCRQKLRPVQFLEAGKVKRIRGIAYPSLLWRKCPSFFTAFSCLYFVHLFVYTSWCLSGFVSYLLIFSFFFTFNFLYNCNGVEWSKDRTQAAESIKWRPQQAYGSNQFLLVQPQTVFSTHKILTLMHR